uniref:putative disease resistance protein RGA3 n=1 Tax=Fragaria vesca subsp. vesca TaxID=101020 RepID=UPI0005CB4711|nr:PREDICTED: putative disease resistance protein RGA3 [Fragaria vesca subsp. vesca]
MPLFSRWNPVVTNFNLGHKVKEIRERLTEIEKDKIEFDLVEMTKIADDHSVPQGMQYNQRETDSLVEASGVIGRDDDKELIFSHLLHNTDISNEDNVYVISILGMGGLGKTTLAKLVYNDSVVEENFEVKMWVCVSENFEVKSLILKNINAITDQKCEDESLDRMKRSLQDTLRGRKFLLVLDDVWDTESIGVTPEKWLGLKSLLSVGANGSRILVTTRNRSIALLVNLSYMHSLKGLSHKDYISLFIKRAFKKGEEQCYPRLIEIGEDIVNKCGGVPLAVATLGSMLYLNREPHRWLSVRDDDMWSIGNDHILPTLKLSYDALPQHLKPCFAFCSLFPKDFEFHGDFLVYLWVAQGYLKTCKKNEDLDKMGMDYIIHFCSRSLFQVANDLRTRMIFKMHDLVHDIAISVAQAEYSTVNFRPSSAFEMVRHVSISEKDLLGEEAQVPDFLFKSTKLRTFLIPYGDGKMMNQHFVKTCISRFKYMRVLDVSGSPLEKLPSSIDLEALPSWLEDYAIVLQSIAVKQCDNLTELPELQIFTFLEQLLIKSCSNLLALPQGLHCLTELRELKINGCPKLSKSCKRQLKGENWSKFAREAKIELDSDVDTNEEEDKDEGVFDDHNAISSDN